MFGSVGPGSTRVGAALESASNLAMPGGGKACGKAHLWIAGCLVRKPLLPLRHEVARFE